MGNKTSAPVHKEAFGVDANHDGKISREEMAHFIDENAQLYAMLSVNLNLPEEECKRIATDVAHQLAKKRPNQSLRDLSPADRERDPTMHEFENFLNRYAHDAKGQQEFFHRTVFTVYDLDKNGYIDVNELDNFLDVFYEAGSIFAGDARLPPKEQLKKEVLEHLDTNRDGRLSFDELRSLISGGAQSLGASNHSHMGLSNHSRDSNHRRRNKNKNKNKRNQNRAVQQQHPEQPMEQRPVDQQEHGVRVEL